jgi:hypothetical protein
LVRTHPSDRDLGTPHRPVPRTAGPVVIGSGEQLPGLEVGPMGQFLGSRITYQIAVKASIRNTAKVLRFDCELL